MLLPCRLWVEGAGVAALLHHEAHRGYRMDHRSREDTKSTAAVRPRGWDSATRLSRMEEYLVAEYMLIRPEWDE